jgi:hypothetical protein
VVDPALGAPELSSLLVNLRLERALLDALTALDSLEVVSFKGTVLTRRLHGNLSARVSTDNDLLVRPRDFRRAIELLLSRGYRLWGPISASMELLDSLDQVEFYPPPDREQVVLDLHCRVFSRRCFAADEAIVWQNLEATELHRRRVSTFTLELEFVHLVAHAVSHWLSRRTIEDVRVALRVLGPRLDFDRVQAIAASTIGLETLEIVLSSLSPGELPWARQKSSLLRARILDKLLPMAEAPGFRALAVALLVLPPQGAVSALVGSLYPGQVELSQRFGPKPVWDLAFRHAQSLARKWTR